MDDLLLMKDLSDQERLMVQNEVIARSKNPTTGVLLSLLLGGLGAHRFYMGQNGLGVVYLLFCWTLIPGVIAFVECFLMSGRIREYNATLMEEVVLKTKALRDCDGSPPASE